MEGRETGTRGFERAATYVASEFSRLGLKPLFPDYYQPLQIRRARVEESKTSLTIDIARQQRLSYGTDFVSYGSTRSAVFHVTGPLRFAGFGVTVPGGSYDDYGGRDAAGAIVVAALDAPPGLSPDDEARFGTLDARARNAAAHHAGGVLLFDAEGIPWDVRVRAARQLGASVAVADLAERPNIPVMILNRARREALFPGDDDRGSASLSLTMRSTQVSSENVAAVLPGSDTAGECVVFVAHLDHVGVGTPVKGDAIYNGTVDNASGVAALLSIAAAFSHATKPSRSVVFLATTGEELGEIGSSYFVRHGLIRPADIVAAINIDGASIVPSNNLAVGGGLNPRLRRFVEAAGEALGLGVRLEPLDGEGSDHVPFARADVPSLWIQAALPDHWMERDYHTPQDDITQPIDFTAMARYTQLNFLVGYGAANGTEGR